MVYDILTDPMIGGTLLGLIVFGTPMTVEHVVKVWREKRRQAQLSRR